MQKQKRLTIAEKKMNATIRNELREKGMIPPVKTKLNRKKFTAEVEKDRDKYLNSYGDTLYINQAINWMISSVKFKRQITLEQIGVLKVIKIAVEIKKFMKSKEENGEEKYNIEELYKNVIDPIIKL